MGVSAAEQSLLDALKKFELQIPQSVNQLAQGGQIDDVTYAIAQDAAQLVPGGTDALKISNTLASVVSSKYGPGSVEAEYAKGASFLGAIGGIIAVLQGRTYESDNYRGAMFYLYFVKGKSSATSTAQVADQDVLNALEWFEQKLGVFISGSEHLLALQQSAAQYMSYFNVNSYTTQDLVRVNLAVEVMQKYMPNFTIGQIPPGAYANTIGVYDNAVLAALEDARIADPNALADTTGQVTTGLTSGSGTIFGMPILLVLAIVAVLLYLFFHRRNK
jgi:hypothetical protein